MEVSLSYDFPEIVGNGTYKLLMQEGATSFFEDGSGGFTIDIPMTLQLSSNPAPLPGAFWLLGSGLLGLAGWRSLRKS